MTGQIIRLDELIALTGLSRATIYNRMNEDSPGYDEDFPKSFSLGGKAIGWRKANVDAWLEKCATTGAKKPPPISKTSNTAAVAGVTTPSTPSNTPRAKSRAAPTPEPRIPQPEVSPQPNNLGEAIVAGGKINALLLGFLQLKTWTPEIGALLVSGVHPALDCKEIPLGGTGLEGKELHASNGRFHQARRIVRWWNEQDEPTEKVTPIDFLSWCTDDVDINTEWLRLLLDLAGRTDMDSVDLTPSRFALLMNSVKKS